MEQLFWRVPLGNLRLSNRLRIEQRFLNDEGRRYSRHRFRYRGLLTAPLGKTLYTSAEGEILYTAHAGGVWNARLGGSVGVRLSDHLRLQGGYVRFFLPRGTDERLKFILLFNPDLRSKHAQP